MGTKRYDWAQIKTEYITGNIGQKALAEKYGVTLNVLKKYARKEDWVGEKRKYALKVVEKAVQKEANRQAKALAKELQAAETMSDVILAALKDDKQFKRWIVTEGSHSVEKVFEKVDTKAMKDAMATLKMIEQMKRSVQGLLTLQEETQRDIALRKIALEEKRADADVNPKDTTVVVKFEGDNAEDWSE